MKKTFISVLCILLGALMLVSCTPGADPIIDPDAPVGFEEAVRVRLGEKLSDTYYVGLGGEVDPTDPDITDTMAQVMSYLKIDVIRVRCEQLWYEPQNDNSKSEVAKSSGFSFENEDMDKLYAVLDKASELNVDVNLVLWGCPADSWLGYNLENREYTAANDVYEYCENAVELLKYLFNTKEYTCIKQVTFQNEPNLTWVKDTGTHMPSYVTAVSLIDEALSKCGIRNKIDIVLSDDCSNDTSWFRASTQKLNKIGDIYSYHPYMVTKLSTLDSFYTNVSERFAALKENDPGAYLAVNEITLEDTDDFSKAFSLAAMTVSYLSAGASFFDSYVFNSEINGKYGNTVWKLMADYAEKGSEIYPLYYESFDNDGNLVDGCSEVAGVALKTTEGKWIYLLVSKDRIYAKPIELFNDEITEGLKYVTFNDKNCDEYISNPEFDSAVSTGFTYVNGKIFFRIPSNSFSIIYN